MSIFAAIFAGPKLATSTALKAAFLHFEVNESLLFIRSKHSAMETLALANVPENERNGLILIQVQPDYYGYSNKAFWDWLQVAFREDLNG